VTDKLIKARTAFFHAERAIISRLVANRDFANLHFGQELSDDVFFGTSLVLLAAMAVLPFSTTCSFGFDLSHLIPGSLWTLIGWLNLGLIKDMIFKTVVMGGFVAQNKTRIIMLEAIALAAIYGLYKQARSLVSKSTTTFDVFESAVNEVIEHLNLRNGLAWNHSGAEQRNNPQCC
jgi:hypothetical protein